MSQSPATQASVAQLQDVYKTLDHLNKALPSHPEPFVDPSAELLRSETLALAHRLTSRLSTPIDTCLSMVLHQAASNTCLKIASDCRLIHHLPPASGDEGATPAVLGAEINKEGKASSHVSEDFLRKVLRLLVTANWVDETSADHFKSTRLTEYLKGERESAILELFFGMMEPVCNAMPAYFGGKSLPLALIGNSSGSTGTSQSPGYSCPTSQNNTAFTATFSTDKSPFEYFVAHRPDLMGWFGSTMSIFRAHSMAKGSWLDYYPVLEGFDDYVKQREGEDSAFLVDIGGGMANDILPLAQRLHANDRKTAKLVLEDKPETVVSLAADAEKSAILKELGVEAVAHDFFTPQPIKGAKYYYLHAVLHDWPTSDCVKILKNLTPVMKKGYSKVLINDSVLTAMVGTADEEVGDFTLMAHFGGGERYESDWKSMCEQAGLKFNRVLGKEGIFHNIVEAELA